MASRDDFSTPVKTNLALRVGYLCSNPNCRALTTGPHQSADKAINLGVAAHITAASQGGPRFDASLTSEGRAAAENGIWLCQNCAKLVDSDVIQFTVALLQAWKAEAEEDALHRIGKTAVAHMPSDHVAIATFQDLPSHLPFDTATLHGETVRKVFLSYAREDVEAARSVYKHLTQQGADVWFDEARLVGGQRWEQEIPRAINASDYFVALLSRSAITKRGYVQKELRVALEVLEKVPDSDIFLIPVRLEPCEPMDNRLRSLHWIDLFPSFENGLAKILSAVGALSDSFGSFGSYEPAGNSDERESNKKSAVHDCAEAKDLLDRDMNEAAIQSLSRAIRASPRLASAYVLRGIAYQRTRQYEHAVADFSEAIRLKPNNPDAYVNRGDVRGAWLADGEGALTDFNEAIRLDAGNAGAYARRGAQYRIQKDYAHAIADLEHSITLDPRSANSHYWLGLAYQAAGRTAEAVRSFDAAIGIWPNYVNALYCRGKCHQSLANSPAALSDFGRVIDEFPHYDYRRTLDARVRRARILVELGEYATAVGDFAEAVRLKPADAGLRYAYGETLVKSGQQEAAKEQFLTGLSACKQAELTEKIRNALALLEVTP